VKPFIHTIEGDMSINDGDWIITDDDWLITDGRNEKYPCPPDRFEQTYEKV